jgi:hypothetical protein
LHIAPLLIQHQFKPFLQNNKEIIWQNAICSVASFLENWFINQGELMLRILLWIVIIAVIIWLLTMLF